MTVYAYGRVELFPPLCIILISLPNKELLIRDSQPKIKHALYFSEAFFHLQLEALI